MKDANAPIANGILSALPLPEVKRVVAGLAADGARLLLRVASICWSGAFVLLLLALARPRRPARVPRGAG